MSTIGNGTWKNCHGAIFGTPPIELVATLPAKASFLRENSTLDHLN